MTDEERLERLEKIKSEQESFMELYERKNRKQQDLIARDFMHQHSGYLIERVQELEKTYKKTYNLLADSIEKQKSLQAELDEDPRQAILEGLYEENGRLHEAVEMAMSYVQNGRSSRANKMYEYFRGVLEKSNG